MLPFIPQPLPEEHLVYGDGFLMNTCWLASGLQPPPAISALPLDSFQRLVIKLMAGLGQIQAGDLYRRAAGSISMVSLMRLFLQPAKKCVTAMLAAERR